MYDVVSLFGDVLDDVSGLDLVCVYFLDDDDVADVHSGLHAAAVDNGGLYTKVSEGEHNEDESDDGERGP